MLALYSRRLFRSTTGSLQQQRQYLARYIHSGQAQQPDGSATPASSSAKQRLSSSRTRPYATVRAEVPFTKPPAPPLSVLPLSTVLRSLCVSTISSYPLLLGPSLGILSLLSESKSPLLDPDKNIALKHIIQKTLYAQFCAGENAAEVRNCVANLKHLGYAGVILGYSKELVVGEEEARKLEKGDQAGSKAEAKAAAEISAWKDGTLATVDLAGDDSFVAVKFTGAGDQAMQHLLRGLPPSPALEEAMAEICERAKTRNVRLLIDAEQQAVQPTIDDWTMSLARRYNNEPSRRALVYGTYQAYLRSTPVTLSRHMSIAKSEGFVLGAKLVRGAYLGSEPRHLIWAQKEETDRAYDSMAESMIQRRYGELLKPDVRFHASETFPEINLVLASHNRASVEKAQKIRNEQFRLGQPQIEMSYGQLFGMADDLSCQLAQSGRHSGTAGLDVETPKVYKAVVWGSVRECMKYLLRRGQENRDAASRTSDTRRAMAKELQRRLFGFE